MEALTAQGQCRLHLVWKKGGKEGGGKEGGREGRG